MSPTDGRYCQVLLKLSLIVPGVPLALNIATSNVAPVVLIVSVTAMAC